MFPLMEPNLTQRQYKVVVSGKMQLLQEKIEGKSPPEIAQR